MSEHENERLRRAFATAPSEALAAGECPGDDVIWAFARGELPPERAPGLLAHFRDCGACAESWRLARDLGQSLTRQPTRLRLRWAHAGLAAAVLLVVAMVWILPGLRQDAVPVEEFREAGRVEIASELDEGTPLLRDAFVLRWTAGPPGSLYSVRVLTEDLDVIARADDLEQPDYTVAPAAFDGLPPGTTVVWRVEALLPDASRVASPAFRAVVE